MRKPKTYLVDLLCFYSIATSKDYLMPTKDLFCFSLIRLVCKCIAGNLVYYFLIIKRKFPLKSANLIRSVSVLYLEFVNLRKLKYCLLFSSSISQYNQKRSLTDIS